MDERLKKMREQVNDLLQMKEDNDRQQITIENFNGKSEAIMRKNHFVATGNAVSSLSFLESDFISLEATVAGEAILLPAVVSP